MVPKIKERLVRYSTIEKKQHLRYNLVIIYETTKHTQKKKKKLHYEDVIVKKGRNIAPKTGNLNGPLVVVVVVGF